MSFNTTALKALQLKAKHQAYSLLSGHHLSKLRADGYDFAELREYQIGDDIRNIHWTISAKLGKPYIKELHTNRELSVVVTCLMDASLYYGPLYSPEVNAKQIKMTEVATMLAYASVQNSDLFTGIFYTDTQTYLTPPTKQFYAVEAFSKRLFELDLLGSTLFKQDAIQDIFKRLEKPSLLFILGDFLDEVNLSLLAQKHEVIALIIRHKEEEQPSLKGEVTLHNPHNKHSLETYFGKKTKQAYLQKFIEVEEKRLEHFARYGIRSVTIYTDDEALTKLISLFI